MKCVKCIICEKEIVDGAVCWYNGETGMIVFNMHLECKEAMIE